MSTIAISLECIVVNSWSTKVLLQVHRKPMASFVTASIPADFTRYLPAFTSKDFSSLRKRKKQLSNLIFHFDPEYALHCFLSFIVISCIQLFSFIHCHFMHSTTSFLI